MELFTPLEYLKIDVASNFGMDKKTWKERIKWFDDNEADFVSLVQKAENPALFYAGVKAYYDTIQGKEIGYPISLDATSSGLQLLSIMSGCVKSASFCNVVDTGQREDVYTSIYNIMCEMIGEEGKITREDLKKAIMTSLYSSKAVPKRVFGEGTQLLKYFYKTMEHALPGAWTLNEELLSTWQPNALSHDWVMPDNFHVKVKVMDQVVSTVNFKNYMVEVIIYVNKPTKEGRSNPANITHSVDALVVREIVHRCSITKNQKDKLLNSLDHKGTSKTRKQDELVQRLWSLYQVSGYLSVRILDYLDSLNMGHIDDTNVIKEMIESLPEKPFKILTIHDAFRCHPNYGNDLRIQYNTILNNLANSNILQFIVSQVIGKPIQVNKYGNFNNKILNANYALS